MKTCFVTLLMLLLVGCHVRDMEKEYVFRIPDGPWPDSSMFHSPINDLAEARSIAGWGVEDPNDIGDMSNYGNDYMYYRLNIFDSCCQTIARVSEDLQINYVIYKDKRGNIKLCLKVASGFMDANNNFKCRYYTIIKGDSLISYSILYKYEHSKRIDYEPDTIVTRMLLRDWLLKYYDYPRKRRRHGEL